MIEVREAFEFFNNFYSITDEEIYESSCSKEIKIRLSYSFESQKFVYDKKLSLYGLLEFYYRVRENFEHVILMNSLDVLDKVFDDYNEAILYLCNSFEGQRLKHLNLNAFKCLSLWPQTQS